MKVKSLALAIICSSLLSSCNSDIPSEKNEDVDTCTSVVMFSEYISGPLDGPFLIKRSGISVIDFQVFDSIDLKNVSKLPVYLGCLISDLSFSVGCDLGRHNEILPNLKKISREMSIDSAFTETEMKRFASAKCNDTMIDVLLENIINTYNSIEKKGVCNESDLYYMASYIENNYLLIQTFSRNPDNFRLFQILLDIRLSISTIDNYYRNNTPSNPELIKITVGLSEIRKKYEDLTMKKLSEEQMYQEKLLDNIFNDIVTVRNEMLRK